MIPMNMHFEIICPAYAGVILSKKWKIEMEKDLSRVCGGDPFVQYSPLTVGTICPAYAGVILKRFTFNQMNAYLSRVCGGDPNRFVVRLLPLKFVPRMRG